jgi:hypothetical protein
MKDHQKVILQLKSHKGMYWMRDIGGQLYIKMCMITTDLMMHVKKRRFGDSKFYKASHKYYRGTIYEMGT